MRKTLYFFFTALVASLALVSPAHAAMTPEGWDGDGRPPALEALPVVSVIPTACPYSAAAACSDGTRIWNNPSGDPDLVVYRLRHEMGHVQDALHLDKGERDRFTQLFGFAHGTVWSQGTWPNMDRSPHELFAEAFAWCSLDIKPNGPFTVTNAYNYDPPPKQQVTICATMTRALAD